MLTVAIRAT